MKDDIIVLHARDINKASRIVVKRRFAWLYLGQDIKQKESISQLLGRENRYSIGNLLQEVAHQQRQPFLDFIAELGLHQKNKLHWWASNTAYKSPLVSGLFLLWCYAAIFDEVCSQKKWSNKKSFLVFMEDRWLYRHLWQRHKEDGFSFLSRKSILPELLNLIAKGIALRGYFLLKVTRQIWQTKGVVSKNKAPSLRSDGKEIYIYSWVEDRSFQRNGEFEDAYLGRLPEFLHSNDLSVVYVTPLLLTRELMGKCLNYGKTKFIFLDQYVNLWSIVRSFFSVFTVSSLSKLDGTFSSLKVLLLREVASEILSFSFARNILQYFAFKRFLEKRDGETIIIYPFENQPWEKMLCLAAKGLDKNVKLVGYQHSTVPLLLLNCFLGAGEASSMPLPNFIVTNGEYTLNLLKRAGYGETKFVNGGALRYQYLHKIEKGLTRPEKELKTVLVALPYMSSLAEEMLLVIFDAFRDLTDEKVRFTMKFHPCIPLECLRIQLPAWPAHFQKTDKAVSELLKEVDLVIYSSSTVGMEALLDAVPVIKYRSQYTIELDPLDALDKVAIGSCSEDNIKQVALSVLNSENSHLAEDSTQTLNKLFSPVDEDAWRRIVKL